MGRRWRFWLGFTVSVVALVLVLLGIDLREVAETLAEADYVYLVPAGASMLAYLFTRAVRWRLLLGREVSLARCFWVTNVGYLVSNVLPFRLGDPTRAVVIGRRGGVSTAAALSTVVVERVLDMLLVVAILAATAPFVGQGQNTLGVGLVAGGAAVAALAVLLVLAFRPDWGRGVLRRVLRRLPRVDADRWGQALDGLFEGLSPLRSGRLGLALLAWSVVTWCFVVGYYWATLWAFTDRPPLLQGAFLTCAIGLGMAVPAAPGAMGVFHGVAEMALVQPFGVAKETAVSIAFAAHAFQYVLQCVLGLVGLAREGLSLAWVRREAGRAGLTEEAA